MDFKTLREFQRDNFNVDVMNKKGISFHYDCLLSEIGELATLTKSINLGKVKLDDNIRSRIGEELSDIIIILTLMSMAVGVDLDSCLENKLQVIKKRLSSVTERERYGNCRK